jgi:PTS system mannose-specific IIA component
MMGIVIVTHGTMGRAMIQTAEMIVGHQRNVHAVALDPDRNLDWLQGEVEQVVRLADEGQGVLIMVDLFGGTPANAVAASMRWHQYECLCGFNLPMLLEALLAREQTPLQELSARIEAMACQSVVNLKAVLERGVRGTEAPQGNP